MQSFGPHSALHESQPCPKYILYDPGSLTPITELYIFSTFADNLQLKDRTCSSMTKKEELNKGVCKAASHLWVYGCLPQAGLIVAEHSSHHLKLLLCQVWRGQPQTFHPRDLFEILCVLIFQTLGDSSLFHTIRSGGFS